MKVIALFLIGLPFLSFAESELSVTDKYCPNGSEKKLTISDVYTREATNSSEQLTKILENKDDGIYWLSLDVISKIYALNELYEGNPCGLTKEELNDISESLIKISANHYYHPIPNLNKYPDSEEIILKFSKANTDRYKQATEAIKSENESRIEHQK